MKLTTAGTYRWNALQFEAKHGASIERWMKATPTPVYCSTQAIKHKADIKLRSVLWLAEMMANHMEDKKGTLFVQEPSWRQLDEKMQRMQRLAGVELSTLELGAGYAVLMETWVYGGVIKDVLVRSMDLAGIKNDGRKRRKTRVSREIMPGWANGSDHPALSRWRPVRGGAWK